VTPPIPQRARLAARLKELRAGEFRSGNQFAAHIGWPQPRVSKIETGAQRPSAQDISAWVNAVGAGPEVEAELLAMLAATRFSYVTHRENVDGGLAASLAFFAALEAQAAQIAEFQPAFIPGIVQTAAYARELLALHGGPVTSGASAADVETLIATRIKRQQILYQPDKRIDIVIGETALHDPPGTIETLAGQLDRLVAVSGLPAVHLAVLRTGTPMPILPLGSFVVHDDRHAFVETMTGEQQMDDPGQVAEYRKAFELLRAASLTGPDVVALVQRVAGEIRG
jgi:hypothetical protein